jgi:TPR repeat protein
MSSDWSRLENVRSEWPADDLEPKADLEAWRQGMQLYDDRDDYASMVRSAGLMCRALRYELYGRGVLVTADLPNTTHRVLFGSCFPPPDGKTLPEAVRTQVRLGLTIVKKYGWQATQHGGTGEMEEFLRASWMVLTMALAPSERPWEGDPERFFTTNPVIVPDEEVAPAKAATPAEATPGRSGHTLVDELYEAAKSAERGDPAAEARMRGLAATAAGDSEAALTEFEAAAQMGDVEAMFEAGNVAEDLGLAPQARYWFEAAAARDHLAAAYNVGVGAYRAGDLPTAVRWLEQAGASGLAEAYAALTQMASETSDRANEVRWSRAGADLGQSFCQVRYAQLLMQDHPADRTVILQQAIPLLKLGAEQEAEGAAFLLGVAYGQIGDSSDARLWLKQAEAEGDADATRVMRENGLA